MRLRRDLPGVQDVLRVVPVPAGALVLPAFAMAAAAARFAGREGQVLALPDVVLAGAGAAKSALDFWRCGGTAWPAVSRTSHVVLDGRGLAPDNAAGLAAGLSLRAWNAARHKSAPEPDGPESLTLLVDDKPAAKRCWRCTAAGWMRSAWRFRRHALRWPCQLPVCRRLSAKPKRWPAAARACR